MKKILFHTQDNFDAIRSRAPMSEWFYENKNLQCDILCPEGQDVKLSNGKIIYYKKRGLSFENYSQLKKLINTENYDLVISRAIEQVILISFIRTRRTKVVFFLAGFGKLFDQGPIKLFLTKSIYKFFFQILVYLKSAGVLLQNIEDINYLGIKNTHLMNGSGIDIKPVEKNKKLNKIKIVTATRLMKTKGLSSIFKLCELLLEKPNIEYYILGDFKHLTKNEINIINKFNLSPNIYFEGFQFPITQYLNKSNFAYFPSEYPEGSPRFLIESIMHGLILFTNPMPGCSALISNKNGFLITSEEETLRKIIQISEDETNYNNLSKNSMELFLREYESNIVYEKLYCYLQQQFINHNH